MIIFKRTIIALLSLFLSACMTSKPYVDTQLYPTGYLYNSEKSYKAAINEYGRNAYDELATLTEDMIKQDKLPEARQYISLMKRTVSRHTTASFPQPYPHLQLTRRVHALTINHKLDEAKKLAIAGNIDDVHEILEWCCNLKQFRDQTHPNYHQIEEIRKILAPYVAHTFNNNPEKWKTHAQIKHITHYYIRYFSDAEREATRAILIEHAAKHIDKIKQYVAKQKYYPAIKTAELLQEIYGESVAIETAYSLPVLYARARKYHQLLASNPDASLWTQRLHQRIAWYLFQDHYIPMPEYKVYGENKANVKFETACDWYDNWGKGQSYYRDFIVLEEKEATVRISLFGCRNEGMIGGYQKRGMVTKTRWETYEEKVPVYETTTVYEQHKTASYKLDTGQTIKCLSETDQRCTSSFRTTADPIIVPESTYTIPRTKKTIVGYKTVKRKRSVTYKTPGLVTTGARGWSSVEGSVIVSIKGGSNELNKVKSKSFYVDTKKLQEEINSLVLELSTQLDIKIALDFDQQTAYTERYNERLNSLSSTDDILEKESLYAELQYLQALIKKKVGKIPDNIFQQRYGIDPLTMAAVLNPENNNPGSYIYVKGTQYLYEPDDKKYSPRLQLASVNPPRSYGLMIKTINNMRFWDACNNLTWPPREARRWDREINKETGKNCYDTLYKRKRYDQSWKVLDLH